MTKDLKLRALEGMADSSFREELDGREYVCKKNPMGITKFSFKFDGKDKGEFRYTNAQGDKVIPFGVNHNVFGKFPQLGYSNGFGGLRTTDGFMYDDAVSFAWLEDKKLMRIVVDPVVISLVKTCYVVDSDTLFVLAASLLDLAHEVRNRTLKVNKEVRRIDKRHHEIEKIRIILEISCAHKTHAMEVRCKDSCILIDGTVLNDDFVQL
jgi:hypothetical protein